MGIRPKILVLSTVWAVVASVVLVSPVAADSTCDPAVVDPASRTPEDFDNPRQVYWREAATGSNTIRAVGAYLEYLQPGVDDWGAAGNSVWIGLLQPTGTRYVQAGYRSYNLLGVVNRKIFLEWKDDSPHIRIQWDPPAVDSVHDFQLGYSSAPGTSVRFWYDSVLWHTVPALGWVSNHNLIGGETHSRGNQLYGGKWDYEDIDAMRHGIGSGAYINYGGSSVTTFSQANQWDGQFEMWIYQPNQQTYNGSAQMDTFDWDCF